MSARRKLVAMIGTDAIDADTGPVKTAYTLTAPAGKHEVISPLTTMVQAKIDSDAAAGKATSVDAAASFVQTRPDAQGLRVRQLHCQARFQPGQQEGRR